MESKARGNYLKRKRRNLSKERKRLETLAIQRLSDEGEKQAIIRPSRALAIKIFCPNYALRELSTQNSND